MCIQTTRYTAVRHRYMITALTVAAERKWSPRRHAQVDRGQPGRQIKSSSHTQRPATYTRCRYGDGHLGHRNGYVDVFERNMLWLCTRRLNNVAHRNRRQVSSSRGSVVSYMIYVVHELNIAYKILGNDLSPIQPKWFVLSHVLFSSHRLNKENSSYQTFSSQHFSCHSRLIIHNLSAITSHPQIASTVRVGNLGWKISTSSWTIPI